MKINPTWTLAILQATALLFGAGCGSKDGGQTLSEAAVNEAAALARASQNYRGEWNSIPADDRTLILRHFGGDETAAQTAIAAAGKVTLGVANNRPAQMPGQS